MRKQHLKAAGLLRVFINLTLILAFDLPGKAFALDVPEKNPTQVQGSGFVNLPDESEKAATTVVVKKNPKFDLTNNDSELTTEEQLRKAWQEEMAALKAKEQTEWQAMRLKDEYDKKHTETARELAVKKRKIYEYKDKQDQFASEIENMKTEITALDGHANEIEKDLKHAEERAQIQEVKFKEVKTDLDTTKNNLKVSLEKMHVARDVTARKINNYMIEMQRMRAEIATSESDIARTDNDRARVEAEEMQVRSQWSSLSSRAQALREDKTRILAELHDMKSRLEAAKKDYAEVKAEWTKADKEKVQAEQEAVRTKTEINAQMRRLETDSSYAYNQKANAEAEKIRHVAEIDKLKTDLAYVKKRNQDAIAEADEAQGSVMESRLAFETAKADLVRELAYGETAKLKKDAVAVKLRGLASAAESSDMIDAHKPWVVTKVCHVTRTPASTGDVSGKLKIGERLIAAPAGGGYVKILNSSGRSAYVPMSCGFFAE